MKFFYMLSLLLSCVSPTGVALAQSPQQFGRSELRIDLLKNGEISRLERAIRSSAKSRLVFVDWHIANFGAVDLFQFPDKRKETESIEDYSARACEKIAETKRQSFQFSGNPVKDQLHLLVSFDLRMDRDVFSKLSCEYFSSGALSALRIKGFFYVDDERIATAESFQFRSIQIDPTRIDKKVLR